jgi:hypothetical protein
VNTGAEAPFIFRPERGAKAPLFHGHFDAREKSSSSRPTLEKE